MAGSKRIPLKLGIDGPVIGSGVIDENGLFMAEIEDQKLVEELFPKDMHFSVYVPEKNDGRGD